MARDINLNSTDWCNLVFEGKNKAYGAYEMRQTSSNRHLWSLGIIALVTLAIAFVPQFIQAITPEKMISEGYKDTLNICTLTEPEEEKPIEPLTSTPPPPPMVQAIQFTPPVITPDDEVAPEEQMRSQEELSNARGIISTVSYESDVTDGVDPGTVLKEQREQITGTTAPEPPREFVEVMPQFPGGQGELMKYLGRNIKYPTIAAEQGIEGRVILKFVVGKDGKISDVKVVKTLDPSCDREAMRVVQSMPKWIPGRQNGNAVAVYFNLPVLFKLQK